MATLSEFIVGSDPSVYEQIYEPASTVAAFHTLPRFSHTNDFSQLFSSDPDEVQDYSLGLLFIACLIVSFFTVWGCLVMLLKCLGPKHLGVFSGNPYEQMGKSATVGRSIFSFSCVMVIVFSLVLVSKGLADLQHTADTIEATNTDVIKIHDEFTGISTNLRTVSREATPVRDELVEFLKQDICPLNPGSATEREVREVGATTLVAMQELSNFIQQELKDLDYALQQTKKATEDITQSVEETQFTGTIATLVMIPYFIVPALLLVTLLFGWFEIYSEFYYSFTTWFLMPLFILMVITAYLSCGFMVLATQGNADWCSGGASSSPEGTIQTILGQYNLTQGTIYYDTIMFYSNQCKTDSPWGFLEGYYVDLTNAKQNLEFFRTTVVQATPEQLSQECGVEFGPALQLLNQLQTYTTILTASTDRAMGLMSCKNVVPLYTTTVYEGTCDYSITAATWIFACSFVISFFGMLMIMFRGAYYPIFYYEGKELEYGISSDDEAGLEEEDSEDYIDESMVDTDVYQDDDDDDDDDDGLGDALADDDDTEYGGDDSIEYEESEYGGSQSQDTESKRS